MNQKPRGKPTIEEILQQRREDLDRLMQPICPDCGERMKKTPQGWTCACFESRSGDKVLLTEG